MHWFASLVWFTYTAILRLYLMTTRGLDALVLGLGSRRFLDQLTVVHYERNRMYRGDAHNRLGLLPWEARLMSEFFPASGRLLITAVGGGREALALADAGWSIVATESVSALVNDFRRRNDQAVHPVTIYALPADQMPVECDFDAAIIGWGGYSHIQLREHRIAYLKNVSGCVRSGGPILLSWLEKQEFGRADKLVARVGSILRRLQGRRPVEAGDIVWEGGFRRWFRRGEVEDEVHAAGLEIVAVDRSATPAMVARRRV